MSVVLSIDTRYTVLVRRPATSRTAPHPPFLSVSENAIIAYGKWIATKEDHEA